MREIKFRAWDLDNHEMYYSHLEESNGEDKIDWRIDCDGVFFEEIQIIDTCPGGKGHKSSREWRKPNQIAMQHTGIKDKNGKEIYEGDTVRFNIPKLDDEHPGYSNQEGVVKCSNIGSLTFGNWQYQYATDIEVIGNIYQK